MEAKDALQHAIEANPKAPAPYLRLARVANKLGDWDTAAKSEDALLAIDKRLYPEIYLHQASRARIRTGFAAEAHLGAAQLAIDQQPERQRPGPPLRP